MRLTLALLIAVLMFAVTADAQPQEGAVVSAVVGVAAVNSGTDVVVAVSAGYRFNRVFGLGIELTSVPSLSSDFQFPRIPSFAFDDDDGSMTVFTTNVRLEIPTTSARVVPYAEAGGGVANVEEHFPVFIAYEVFPTSISATPPATVASSTLTGSVPLIYPPRSYPFSTTSLALTAGGGVSILAGRHLSIDVDLRYLRLMDAEDRDVGRFGAGVSYRF